jgi:hypothetical protein
MQPEKIAASLPLLHLLFPLKSIFIAVPKEVSRPALTMKLIFILFSSSFRFSLSLSLSLPFSLCLHLLSLIDKTDDGEKRTDILSILNYLHKKTAIMHEWSMYAWTIRALKKWRTEIIPNWHKPHFFFSTASMLSDQNRMFFINVARLRNIFLQQAEEVDEEEQEEEEEEEKKNDNNE